MSNLFARYSVRAAAAIAASMMISLPLAAQLVFPVERPTLNPGDKWMYRTLDGWNNSERSRTETELVAVEKEHWVFRGGNPVRTFRQNFDRQPCRQMQGSDAVVCTGPFRFPITADMRHDYDRLPWTNGEGYQSARCQVKGVETVTVPAGSFDAVRIDCTGNSTRMFGGNFSGRTEETLWYSPAVKGLVRSQYTAYSSNGQKDTVNITELVGFKPAQ